MASASSDAEMGMQLCCFKISINFCYFFVAQIEFDLIRSAKRRSEVVEWLNGLFSDFRLSPNASEEELRARLIDGAVLCAILRRLFPRYVEEVCLHGSKNNNNCSLYIIARS